MDNARGVHLRAEQYPKSGCGKLRAGGDTARHWERIFHERTAKFGERDAVDG